MHDDRRLNPLRLLIGGLIIVYFAWLVAAPAPYQPGVKPTQPVAAQPAAPASVNCHGDIQAVTFGQSEVRLQITGAGEHIRVFMGQDSLVISTKEAGSAGEYRVRTPGPATAVQLDDCPVIWFRKIRIAKYSDTSGIRAGLARHRGTGRLQPGPCPESRASSGSPFCRCTSPR